MYVFIHVVQPKYLILKDNFRVFNRNLCLNIHPNDLVSINYVLIHGFKTHKWITHQIITKKSVQIQ